MSESNSLFKSRRKTLSMTQQDAAVLLGVSRITYIKWEQDENTMPLGKHRQLNREFDRLQQLKETIEG